MAVAWSWLAWVKLQLFSPPIWLLGRHRDNFPLHHKISKSRWQNDPEFQNCFVKNEPRALPVVWWPYLCGWGREQSVSRQWVTSRVARHCETLRPRLGHRYDLRSLHVGKSRCIQCRFRFLLVWDENGMRSRPNSVIGVWWKLSRFDRCWKVRLWKGWQLLRKQHIKTTYRK